MFFRTFRALVDPFAETARVDTPPTQLWPFMRQYLWPMRHVLGASAAMSLVVGVIEIWLVGYVGRLVDLLQDTPRGDFWALYGLEVLAVAAFVMVIRPALQIVDAALLNVGLMPNLATLVRWRAHRHVLGQSVGWFANDFAGRIANRVMQTPGALNEAAFQVFDSLVYAVIYVVGATVLLANTDLRLAVPLLLWVGLYIALMAWAIPRVGRASEASSDARSTVTGRIVDSYTNIQTVKLFAHTEGEEAYAKEAIADYRVKFARQMEVISIMDFGLAVLNGLLLVGVVGYAVLLWQQGVASVGLVAAAAALVLRLSSMTGWIMWALSSLFENLGVVREGMGTIAQPIALRDAPGAPALAVTAGEIRIEAVGHRYGKAAGGLDGVSLTIRPGEKLGLVGRSGAGKSTLVNLILRFFDPETGRVLIDRQDIAGVTQESLRRQIGMVTQDTALLHRSVRENIAYGRPDASDAEIEAAARKAEAHGFILGLEDPEGRRGYDAHVGERGVKLSGGQRQRIALARVILKDAPILILDEATSALDSEVEAAIQATLYGVMEGKTVIAIAHRLSTIAELDRIVVLDDGRVAETGSHAALLARDGPYAGFWRRQSGGFIGIEAAE